MSATRIHPLIALLLSLGIAAPTTAQRAAPVAVHVFDSLVIPPARSAVHGAQAPQSNVDDGRIRLLLAAAGTVGGGYVGGRVADSRSNRYDLGRMEDVLIGAAIGSVIGSVVLASVPAMHSSCTIGKRLALGLLGSAVGAASGALISVLVGDFVGATVGAAVGAQACSSRKEGGAVPFAF